MFQRVHQYDLIDFDGRLYRPRAYGDLRADGMWDGWLVFFPLGGNPAIASDRETTQSTFADLTVWAAGLSPVYLVGALERAMRIAEEPPVIARLAAAEYDALDDAVRLESKAKIDELEAETDRIAAETARLEAEQIHRERIAAEAALAATEAASATLDAEVHEAAAREARAVAAGAARRTRRSVAKIARGTTKRAGKHK